MIVIPSTNSAWFDCDDTLIAWNPTQEQLDQHGIEITCPGSLFGDSDGDVYPGKSWTAKIVPHKAHIEAIKKHKLRGHLIVVWSAGGWDWAEAVVKALKLEQYVDLVISKPTWAYDDMPAERILTNIKWLEDK